MSKAPEGEKLINMPIPIVLHTEIKIRAAKEHITIVEVVRKALETYFYNDKTLTDEDIQNIKKVN